MQAQSPPHVQRENMGTAGRPQPRASGARPAARNRRPAMGVELGLRAYEQTLVCGPVACGCAAARFGYPPWLPQVALSMALNSRNFILLYLAPQAALSMILE